MKKLLLLLAVVIPALFTNCSKENPETDNNPFTDTRWVNTSEEEDKVLSQVFKRTIEETMTFTSTTFTYTKTTTFHYGGIEPTVKTVTGTYEYVGKGKLSVLSVSGKVEGISGNYYISSMEILSGKLHVRGQEDRLDKNMTDKLINLFEH